jgi:hypothetical protein
VTTSALSETAAVGCPHSIDDVDLFGEGAQEHWYDAYPILLRDAPVYRLPGEGLSPQSDAFILSRYEDINRVVKDPVRFTPITTLMLEQIAAEHVRHGQPNIRSRSGGTALRVL